MVEKDLVGKLEAELEKLKHLLGLGHHLRVKWIPNNHGKLSGEVKRDCIYIYEEEKGSALETLRHEFLDYAISQVIEPYKEIANRLISIINEDAYKRKERLVEAICHLTREKTKKNTKGKIAAEKLAMIKQVKLLPLGARHVRQVRLHLIVDKAFRGARRPASP